MVYKTTNTLQKVKLSPIEGEVFRGMCLWMGVYNKAHGLINWRYQQLRVTKRVLRIGCGAEDKRDSLSYQWGVENKSIIALALVINGTEQPVGTNDSTTKIEWERESEREKHRERAKERERTMSICNQFDIQQIKLLKAIVHRFQWPNIGLNVYKHIKPTKDEVQRVWLNSSIQIFLKNKRSVLWYLLKKCRSHSTAALVEWQKSEKRVSTVGQQGTAVHSWC